MLENGDPALNQYYLFIYFFYLLKYIYTVCIHISKDAIF